MNLGIDHDRFWSMTPEKIRPYVRACEEKEKRYLERENMLMWVNGIYIMYALAAVLGEDCSYPEKPLQIFRSDTDDDASAARDAELFGAYAAVYNRNFREK